MNCFGRDGFLEGYENMFGVVCHDDATLSLRSWSHPISSWCLMLSSSCLCVLTIGTNLCVFVGLDCLIHDLI